jgi:hypothetical protein
MAEMRVTRRARRRPVSRSAIASALVALAAVMSLDASTPRFFQAGTQADFLRGDVENLSIDSRGQLVLGPATNLVYETAAPFLWSVVPGADGSLYIGTGNEGRVFKVDARGNGTLFFDSTELEVHALTPAPGGGLYVGTSPDGRIYKVDPSGVATTFFAPGEKYIWALATDRDGTLYASTGDKGNIYRIAPDGTGTRFYQTKATHATTLAFDRDGNLLVGTESPGRVMRIDASGRGFVLLDSPFSEISALRFDQKGTLYVAAVNGDANTPGQAAPRPAEPAPTTTEPAGAPVPTVSTEITAIAVVDAPSGPAQPAPPREDRRGAKGAIYRIAPDGLWDQLWESREDAPYDVTFDGSGRLIVGTGSRGKIFRLEGDPLQPTLLARAGAQQVTALYNDDEGSLYYATANPGKLYRLTPDRADKGTYESEPRDAGMVASWGSLSWRGTTGDGRIEISTRSGNTATPDDTWSPWSRPYSVAEGSPITSPKARYLQWRAVLSGRGEGPVLTSVTLAYLQVNLRPQVRSITVHQPGIVFQKPYSTGDPDLAGFENQTTPDRRLAAAATNPQQGTSTSPSLGRRTYQKGLRTFIWRADDENDDELSYEVQYRREGEQAWKVLRQDVTESILVWDTTTVPNGTYFVRIVATDARSNAAGTALSGELVSPAFEVDNLPPEITVDDVATEGRTTVITFDARDNHSPVERVEYSLDGQQWRGVFPVDGIADSRMERYEIRIEDPIGPRGVTVRASDAMDNVSTTQIDPSRTR